MYNSNKGNNSGSFSGSKPTDSPTGPGSRFQNKNLNSSLKAPAATSSKPGIAVIRGSKGVGKSIGGAAAPTASLAPVPLNTPSIKRENNGNDPNVNIVQSHSREGVWGHGATSGGVSDNSPVERPSTQPTSTVSKPAPWAKSMSTANVGEGTHAANTDSSSTKPSYVSRHQASNWADVDIESDDDDDGAPASRVLGAVQAASSRPAEPQTGFGYNNAFNPNSGDYRKDRSGSFNNEPDRRFGGYPPQDDRFANRGGPSSGDARSNYSSQGSGDFGGRGNFNNAPYNNNGFGQPPAMRNNNFAPRGGGPVGNFGGFPSSSNNNNFQQGQRPPGYGAPQTQQGHFSGGAKLNPEQQRIEEARNEVQELEAKRLRKRTMSSEEHAPANASGSATIPPHLTAPSSSLSAFGMPASADQRDGGFHQGRRDYNSHGYNAGQAQGQGAPDGRYNSRDYNNPNNFSSNNFFHNNNSGEGHNGYGNSGAESQRAPYRMRGPSFDNAAPEGGMRSFGTGGHGGQHFSSGEQYRDEPMWERVKPPQPVQQQRSQQMESPSDRWATRQSLPPPPMLPYASNPANVAGLTVPPAVYRPERERGPRSGTTPRGDESDRNTSITAPPSMPQSQYDPSNKPFSSLFGGKSAAEAPQLDYPLHSSEQHPRTMSYDQESRPAYATAPAGGPRPKMLYDPQSNEYRPLEKDTPKASYSAKALEKKTARTAGPPTTEDALVDERTSARKSLHVDRIEQNTEHKWARAKETGSADTTTARPARHTVASSEGHEESESHEQGREAYLAERKAMRQKERDERGPRTKGFLFKFNAEGTVERVLTAQEAEAKQRKLDRANHASKPSRRSETAVEPSSYEHLDFGRLTNEEFQALPKAKKDEIRAKHQAEKAARRAEPREPRQEPRRAQYAPEHAEALTVENLSILGHKVPTSAATSGPCDHSDLDIQQTAWEVEAHRSQQPIKSFVPGQSYGNAAAAVPLPHEIPQQNWREGARVIPAARMEQQNNLHHHQQQQQPYQTIVQPHNYQPIIHQPVVNHPPVQQSWNYSSYAGVSEPALYGGNTSFLGQQESTVGQIFSALQSLHPENDVEVTESCEAREAREHYQGPPGSGNGTITRGGRGEDHAVPREYTGGRGGGSGSGRGSYSGRGRSDKFQRFERPRRADEDQQDARVTSEPREGRGSGRTGGRGGRGAGRGPPADHEGEGSARPVSAYAGRGGRGDGRGEGRGEGRGGRGRGAGKEYKPRAGPPSEHVVA